MSYDERLLSDELKIELKAEPIDGMSLADYDFTAEVYATRLRSVRLSKSEGIPTDDGYVFLVDSTQLGVGVVRCRVVAEVPDADFGDKLRHSVADIEVLGRDGKQVKVVREYGGV